MTKTDARAMRKRRQLRLWFCLVVPGLLSVFLSAGIIATWWQYRQLRHWPGSVESYIGVYPDILQGQKAGLRELAQDIARHPEADVFIVRRTTVVFALDETEWWETFYSRRSRTIGDGNFNYGDTEYWGHVTDKMVESVAQNNGNFTGFPKAGAVDLQP